MIKKKIKWKTTLDQNQFKYYSNDSIHFSIFFLGFAVTSFERTGEK